jgi:hypothetical protein
MELGTFGVPGTPGRPGWIILDIHCRCHGLPAAVEADLAALLQGFPRPGSGHTFHDEIALEPGSSDTAAQVEYQLISAALARTRGRWILHAGAVEGPRGTCLIVGESGAGKTSLTLWLWASGLRLVTDDLCPLPHGAAAPERFPRALHMDGDYSPRLLARIPPPRSGFPADYYPFPDDTFPKTTADPPRPISDVIILERGPRPAPLEAEVEPLIQADAVHQLLRAVIRTPGFDYAAALADLLALVPRCRVHRLRASTPEGAGAAAVRLLMD